MVVPWVTWLPAENYDGARISETTTHTPNRNDHSEDNYDMEIHLVVLARNRHLLGSGAEAGMTGFQEAGPE